MPLKLAEAYTNKSQQARVVSEAWGETNMYCPRCDSMRLTVLPNNYRAIDFMCPVCDAPFQLKAKGGRIGSTIADGAYAAMTAAIRENRTPNLMLIGYTQTWQVLNLVLIPKFALAASSVVKRPPLSPTARRAGWIGCNIDLRKIPLDARIEVVNSGVAAPMNDVRAKYRRLQPLEALEATQRGWTLDVLRCIRTLSVQEFSTTDAYQFANELQQLHPQNRHVRDKIRQQLQVLRDAGLLVHLDRNRWRLPG
jgi:type II restriction enzyme